MWFHLCPIILITSLYCFYKLWHVFMSTWSEKLTWLWNAHCVKSMLLKNRRVPLGGACWPEAWVKLSRKMTLCWTQSTWLLCWWLYQSEYHVYCVAVQTTVTCKNQISYLCFTPFSFILPGHHTLTGRKRMKHSLRWLCPDPQSESCYLDHFSTYVEFVLPVSLQRCYFYSSLLCEDNDSGLFSVTLFRKAIDDFKHKSRENK